MVVSIANPNSKPSVKLPTISSLLFAIALTLASAIPAVGQAFSIVYSFNGANGGAQPSSPLIRNAQGDLLGTTEKGGEGAGLFFKLTGGREKLLHPFDQFDGENPIGSVVRDA